MSQVTSIVYLNCWNLVLPNTLRTFWNNVISQRKIPRLRDWNVQEKILYLLSASRQSCLAIYDYFYHDKTKQRNHANTPWIVNNLNNLWNQNVNYCWQLLTTLLFQFAISQISLTDCTLTQNTLTSTRNAIYYLFNYHKAAYHIEIWY